MAPLGNHFGIGNWLLRIFLIFGFCPSLLGLHVLALRSGGKAENSKHLNGGGPNEGCEWTDPMTNKHYDISSLTKTVVGDEYVFKNGDWTFKANICGRATSKCNLPTISPGSTPIAFQYQSSSTLGDICTASLGDLMSSPVWSTFKSQNGKFGFQITYNWQRNRDTPCY